MLNKAVIDLNLLVKNALEVKSKLNKGVKFCAVVKADAYGHGAGVVANALYPYVDCFAVALLEEAITLRNAGIDKEILCLTPFFDSETERAVAYDITATVCDAKQVLVLSAAAEKLGKIAYLHLKFNAGMNRLGVDLKTLAELLVLIKGCKNLQLSGMYAHFSAPENKKSLKTQLNKFLLANNLVKGYNSNAICHISASGGFLSGVQADMVRIGILLYGYKPFESDLLSVNPIMRVYAPVLTERKVEKGQTVLYGNHELITDDCFSLIRYGYADGLFRKQVDGQINNRCMDITAVKGCNKGLWQPVMVNAADIAKKYDTISYEILSKCAQRAEKIYVR